MGDKLKAGDHCVDESGGWPHLAHVLQVIPGWAGRPERLRCVSCPTEVDAGAAGRGYVPDEYTVEAHLCRPMADPGVLQGRCGWAGEAVVGPPGMVISRAQHDLLLRAGALGDEPYGGTGAQRYVDWSSVPGAVVVHYLQGGRSVCGEMQGTPDTWPDGHVWVSYGDWPAVTCGGCLSGRPAEGGADD